MDAIEGDKLRGHLEAMVLATLERGYFQADAVRTILDRQAGGADADSKRVWALYMLELWHREFVDRLPTGGGPASESSDLSGEAVGVS